MKASVLRAGDLDRSLLQRWLDLRSASPELSSPYFDPHFTLCVAGARRDVRIAVLEEGASVVGFFPFHHGTLGRARPIGLGFSDYHGVIGPRDLAIDARDLLRACKLTCFEFTHALAAQNCFLPHATTVDVSPVIDISGGYDAYISAVREAGSKQVQKATALARKLGREHGEVRFEVSDVSPDALETLIRWKGATYGTFTEVLGTPWVRAMLDRISHTVEPGLRGQLSSLWAGDRRIALHFGMRSEATLHYWLPAYDAAFSAYSPGILLLLELTAHAAATGMRQVDLGRGLSPYKQRLMNAGIGLLEGRAEIPSVGTVLRRIGRGAEAWARGSRLRPLLAVPGRALKAWGRRKRFR